MQKFRLMDVNQKLHEKDKPGLRHINHEYQKKPPAPPNKLRRFSIAQWLEAEGIELNVSQKVSFSKRVASTMRTLGHKEPEQRRGYLHGKAKSMGVVNIYREDDIPILKTAVDYVLRTKK